MGHQSRFYAGAYTNGSVRLSDIEIGSTEITDDQTPMKPSHHDAFDSGEDLALVDPEGRKMHGIPTRKPQLPWPDTLASIIAASCCSLATAVVTHNHLAWSLGVTYQLVVVGFLLSVMNLCLTYIAPTFFLLCEARYGPSALQNYDAISRASPLGSNVSWIWRAVLLLLAILPLGLSAGYKLFTGGVSTNAIGPGHHLYSEDFGMYAAPGLQQISAPTGLSLMFNVTMPYIQASSTNTSALAANKTFGDPAWDPPMPQFPQAYGFNVLVLGDHSAAVLDVPYPDWLSKIQAALEPGESWNISATVTSSVAIYNETVDEHRNTTSANSPFWEYYSAQGTFYSVVLYNGWNVGLLANDYGPDESWCIVGIYPDPRESEESFSSVAKMYDIVRMPCNGTWTITQGAIQLVDGNCDLDHLTKIGSNSRDQLIFTNNSLTLGEAYMPTLWEFLGPFATTRNESRWLMPTVSTVIASMVWSKATSVTGPGRQDFETRKEGVFVYAGLRYKTAPTIVSARSTLRSSWGLVLLFILQPLLTIIIMLASFTLYEVPIGKDFGMISLLCGVNAKSLEALKGAGLSGKVSKQVRLSIDILEQSNRSGKMLYTVGHKRSNGRIRPRWMYE